MTFEEFLDGLVVAIDLDHVKELEVDTPFVDIEDFDSLATLGVMTFVEIEFDKQIEGEWLWSNKISPKGLFEHLSS